MRRVLGTLLIGILALSACAPNPPGGPNTPSTPAAETTAAAAPDTPPAPEPVEATPQVGVQLFQWNWNSIARECAEVLGPNQFSFVLLSPPRSTSRASSGGLRISR